MIIPFETDHSGIWLNKKKQTQCILGREIREAKPKMLPLNISKTPRISALTSSIQHVTGSST